MVLLDVTQIFDCVGQKYRVVDLDKHPKGQELQEVLKDMTGAATVSYTPFPMHKEMTYIHELVLFPCSGSSCVRGREMRWRCFGHCAALQDWSTSGTSFLHSWSASHQPRRRIGQLLKEQQEHQNSKTLISHFKPSLNLSNYTTTELACTTLLH